MSNEGRLSPEELDDLLDPDRGRLGPAQLPASHGTSEPGPSRLPASYGSQDPPTRSETLEGGDEGPTWTARAGGRLRRSPRLTAAAVALLLVAGIGALGYQRTRPPPLDTRMPTAAWFAPGPTDEQGGNIQGVSLQGDVVTSLVHLQLPEGVPAVTVVALTVPGLGSSSVSQDGTSATVKNTLDCNGIADLSGPIVLPVLHLTRTDAWGRSVSATLPLSDSPGTAAVPASVVADTLRQECVGRIADFLTLIEMAGPAGAGGKPSALVMGVRNPTSHPLLVLGASATWAPADAVIGDTGNAPDPSSEPLSGTLLPARGTATVTLAVRRTDCGATPSRWSANDATSMENGRREGNFTLWISPPQAVPDHSYDNWTSVMLTPAQRAGVVRALAAPCAGAPRISYTASARAKSPKAANRSVLFDIGVRSSQGTAHLDVSDEPFFWSTGAWSSTQAATGRSLKATVTVDSADCSNLFAQMPPPTLGLTVTTPSGSYPFQLTLGNRSVLDTLSTLCTQALDLATARSNGWDV